MTRLLGGISCQQQYKNAQSYRFGAPIAFHSDQGGNWMQTQSADFLIWCEIIVGGVKKIQIIRKNLYRVERLLSAHIG